MLIILVLGAALATGTIEADPSAVSGQDPENSEYPAVTSTPDVSATATPGPDPTVTPQPDITEKPEVFGTTPPLPEPGENPLVTPVPTTLPDLLTAITTLVTPLPSPVLLSNTNPVPSSEGESPAPDVNGTIIGQGATIFIGEQGLNITHALNQANAAPDIDGVPALTSIGWWPSAALVGTTAPARTVDVSVTYASLLVDPANFVGYTGGWYLLDAGGMAANATHPVFSAMDPMLDLRVWDYDHAADVTGTSVSSGTRLGFRIDTNMYAAVDAIHRSPLNPSTDGFINLIVKNESATILTALYNESTSEDPEVAGPTTILKNYVNVQPYFWGSSGTYSWKTNATDNGIALYPDGTYTVQAESTLNHMKDNYKNAGADYTGKTVSAIYTITLASGTGAPVAGFAATPTSGTAPLTVVFTDTSTGSPTEWNWTFGDGDATNATVQNPVHTFVTAGTYTVSLNATNAGGSNTTVRIGYITATMPDVPVANFNAEPATGLFPLTVTFSDLSSNGPTEWNWSFGDGNMSVLQNPVHIYTAAGTYTVSLNATNAAGSNTLTKAGHITVGTPTWNIETVDSDGDVGDYTTLALDSSDNPHISYLDFTNYNLKYAVRNGGSWTTQIVDSGGHTVGWYPSLALDSTDNPRISYLDSFNDDLKYAVWNGASWNIETVSAGGASQEPTSLALDSSGVPHIGYHSFDDSDLKYASWNGTGWTIEVVDNNGVVGLDPSLVLDSTDNPHISYYDQTNADLKYAKWNGAAWSIETVDSDNDVGMDSSLVLDSSGNPHISYYYLTGGMSGNGDLKYAKWNGAAWIIETVDSSGDVGKHTSLALDSSDRPRISYWDLQNDHLKYAVKNGGNWVAETVDSSGNVGWYTSLALDSSNNPHISYYDYTNTAVKYATKESDKAPVVNFSATPMSGTAPLAVTFTDTSTGSPTEWNWSFGDGGYSAIQHPVHVYASGGIYSVSLNASNSEGSDTLTKSSYLTINSSGPSMMYRADPRHTGTYDDGGTRPTDILNWTFETDNSVSNTPAIVGGVVYTGSGDGKMYALDADTGIEYWNFSVFSLNESYSPAVTEGRVYFGSTDGKVYALNASTGNKVWEFMAGESVNSDVTIRDGILYTGSGTPDRIYALNAHDGTERWHFNAAGNVATSPAVADGIVYAGSNDGKMYALHATNGTLLWANTTGDFVHSSPSVVNGTVYFGSFDNTFYALNAMTGLELWHFTAGDFGRSSPAVADGIVYVGNRDGNLYALDAMNGAVVWDYNLGDWVDYSPAVASGVLYIGGSDHHLHALNATTGALLWQFDAGVITLNNVYDPAVADGKVFFGCREGRVYALGGPAGPAPVAGFTATPTTGTVPLTVVFTDTSANIPAQWSWSFGDGDATNATVQNPVHTYAAEGIYTVSLNATNNGGSNVSVRTNYITVNAQPKPKIDTVTPITAVNNRTIDFIIKGSNFDPGSGKTWVNFTRGAFDNLNLTVTEVTPAKINVTMTVPHDAPTGGWNLTVSTVYGKKSDVRKNAVTVSRFPMAVIDKVEPTAPWLRNTTVAFAITGKNFLPGQTSVYLVRTVGGAALNTVNITRITTTRIEGSVDVPANALLGNGWSVNVSTIDSGRNGTRPAAFTVANTPPPTLSSLTPNYGSKNTTVVFTIAGTNFQTGDGKTRVRIYEDVMDTELAVNMTSLTPTKITGTVEVTNDAMAGSHILEVKTVDGGTVTKPAAFSVRYSGIPTIMAFRPDSGYHNETVEFSITGTNFQPGNTVVALKNQTNGAVLNTTNLTRVTSTAISGTIHVPANAPTGYYRLDLTTTDGGVTNKRNAFRVKQVMPPTIASITPTTGAKGSVVAFTIRGTNFQGGDKTTVQVYDVVSGTWLSTTLLQVTETTIIGSVTIPNSAPAGKYTLDVRTADGGTASRYEAFTVNYLGLPSISSIVPATGKRGTDVNFTLKGSNFVDGGTIVRMRIPGSTINSTVLAANSTMVLGYFPIPAGATTGSYRLDVFTQGGGINSRLNGFAVTA
ncbi:MAG TPA: PQQ-binding-like beta-propeller repeat protein [Methanoregula sp.]|nr:PQQ-binding-like beta-propeller repeat protein [Methanoregula sp.]